MQVIGQGDKGAAVIEVRAILSLLGLLDDGLATFDAVFDEPAERAVRAFQQERGLTVTGDVNEETWRALDAARWALGSRVLAHERPEPLVGDDVRDLQERLLELGYDLGRADGIFGRRTAVALATFQREVGLVADGICGPQTMAALHRLGRKVTGGRPTLLRESARFHSSGPALLDKRIVIDPGHGGGDCGISVTDARGTWTESEIAYDLAARLEGRLAAAGTRVYLTRGPSSREPLTEAARAALTNELGADLVISLHLDAHRNPEARGVATYHYGRMTRTAEEDGQAGAITSTLGERLAALVQEELVARTGLLDCRTHAKTWDMLRLTRMPAVRVELGYLTSPADRALLASSRFRDQAVAAIVVAIQRMYLPVDPPVGAGAVDRSLVPA
jgi:N-acetylmuramoyl-L-alanine amidase